jgi:hypothetical protein
MATLKAYGLGIACVLGWSAIAAAQAVTVVGTVREDAPHTSGDKGIPAHAVRGSACGTPLSGTAGDYQPLQLDARGSVCVNIDSNSAGSATIAEAATEAAGAANVAITSAYMKAFDGTTFSRLRGRAGLIASGDFGLVTRPFPPSDGTNTMVLDPCAANAKVYTPISQTANTQLITGTASKKTFICSIVVVGADAENISLVAGTGSTCGTSTVAVLGGATAANGPNLAANGGFAFGNGASAIAATTVNQDNLCLFQSGGGRVAGVMTSVVQ